MFLTLSQVALGGAAGSVLRYLLVAQVRAPMGTLAVNVIGSFVMGVLAVMLFRWQPLLMTGLLGGFTTFSAFSLDAVRLWQDQPGAAIAYVAGSVLLSIFALALGAWLAKGFQ